MLKFNQEGFAQESGFQQVHVCFDNGEYAHTESHFISEGCGLAANAYLDAPPAPKQGFAIVRQHNHWHYVEDHRGTTVYSTEDGSPMQITELGEMPPNYTLQAPIDGAVWLGDKWVVTKALQTEQLEQHRAQLIRQLASKADVFKAQVLVGYPQAEIDSFYRQEREAREWLANPSTPTPMLQAIAENRGVPLELLARKVIEKAEQVAVIMGHIIGTRQAFEDRLLQAKNQDELTRCEQEIEQWQLPNP